MTGSCWEFFSPCVISVLSSRVGGSTSSQIISPWFPPWSARQQRQLSYISEFTSDIRHATGSANVVADNLSRPPLSPPSHPPFTHPPCGQVSEVSEVSEVSDSSLPSPFPTTAQGINFEELASDQLCCPEILPLRKSTVLRLVSVPVKNGSLLCDASTQVLRPLVPSSQCFKIFSALHSLSHPGKRAFRRLISSRFVWRGLANDVRDWCRSCIPCQRGKVLRHVQLRPEKIPVPFRRFSHIHVDLVGPLPPSQGFRYLLTCVDRSTRWPEAIPLQGISTTECASALFHGWIARFGVPAIITSDRGAQFTSFLWSAICNLLGIIHNKTTTFHPQANGMVERFHRQVKNSL